MDYKGIIEKINLIICIPVGRGGSYFFQSLMDDCEQIITLPDRHDYFYPNDFNIESFVSEQMSFFDSNENKYNYGNDFLSKHEKIEFRINEKLFIKYFNEIKKSLRSINKKQIFIIKHLAYAKILGKDLHKLKYIFCHIHHFARMEMNLLYKPSEIEP